MGGFELSAGGGGIGWALCTGAAVFGNGGCVGKGYCKHLVPLDDAGDVEAVGVVVCGPAALQLVIVDALVAVVAIDREGTEFRFTEGEGEGLLYGDIEACGEFIGDRLLKRCRSAPDGLFNELAPEPVRLVVHPTTGVFVACRFGSPGDVQTPKLALLTWEASDVGSYQ